MDLLPPMPMIGACRQTGGVVPRRCQADRDIPICQIASQESVCVLEVGYTRIIKNGAQASWSVNLSPLAVEKLQAKVNAIPGFHSSTPLTRHPVDTAGSALASQAHKGPYISSLYPH